MLGGVALQLSPPFVITEEQLGTVAAVIRESLDAARLASGRAGEHLVTSQDR